MYKITVYQSNKELLKYESPLVPQAGDVFSALQFEDNFQRTVVNRQIIPDLPEHIIVNVTYSFPELVATYNGIKEIPITENY